MSRLRGDVDDRAVLTFFTHAPRNCLSDKEGGFHIDCEYPVKSIDINVEEALRTLMPALLTKISGTGKRSMHRFTDALSLTSQAST